MHLLNALGLADNYDTEWLHNVIANIFEVVLKYTLVLPPHSLYQLEPKLIIEVSALVQSQVGILIISKYVNFRPSPEVICRQPFQLAKGPLVYREIFCQLLPLQQNQLLFIKRIPSQDALRVGYTLIHIHKICDLKVIKHSAIYVAHSAEHCSYLMIKRVDVG